jgi:hypothetical protein
LELPFEQPPRSHGIAIAVGSCIHGRVSPPHQYRANPRAGLAATLFSLTLQVLLFICVHLCLSVAAIGTMSVSHELRHESFPP